MPLNLSIRTEKSRKRTPTLQPKQSPITAINHPKEGEKVSRGHYAFNIGASGASRVEVSVNNGPWQPCRESLGIWWHDWTASKPGDYTLRSRAYGADPRENPVTSELRRFTVRP